MVDSAPPPNVISQVRPARVKLEETAWPMPPAPHQSWKPSDNVTTLTSSQRPSIFKTKPHWIHTTDIQPTKCLPLQKGILPFVAEVLSMTTSRSWVKTGNMLDLLLAFWLVALHFKSRVSNLFLAKGHNRYCGPVHQPDKKRERERDWWYTELLKLIHNLLQYNLQMWP